MAIPQTAEDIHLEPLNPHKEMSQAWRRSLDRIRGTKDPIQHSKLHSESIASYVSSSLMRFDDTGKNLIDFEFTEPIENTLIHCAKTIIETIQGQVHLQISRDYINNYIKNNEINIKDLIKNKTNINKNKYQSNIKNLALVSSELQKFLNINETILVGFEEDTKDENQDVLFHFKQYLPDNIVDLKDQQTVFYSLVNKHVDRLPNLRLYIQKEEKQGNTKYYQRIIYTYAVFLENRQLFGVLHVSYTISEVSQFLYLFRDFNIFPKAKNLNELNEILKEQDIVKTGSYLPKIQEINDKIEQDLYQNLGKQGEIYKFLKIFKEKTKYSSKNQTLTWLKQTIPSIGFKTDDGKIQVSVCLVMNKPGLLIEAISNNLREFWHLEPQDLKQTIMNQSRAITNLRFYYKTYYKFAKEEFEQEGTDQLYQNIAEQQRYSILAQERISPREITLFLKKLEGKEYKYYKLYRWIGDIAPDNKYTIFIMQIEEIKRPEFENGRKFAPSITEEDSLAKTQIIYKYSAIAYKTVFDLIFAIETPKISDQVITEDLLLNAIAHKNPQSVTINLLHSIIAEVIEKSKGTVIFEYAQEIANLLFFKTIFNEATQSIIQNKDKKSKLPITKLFYNYFTTNSNKYNDLEEQYERNQKLVVKSLGTRRLPDIYISTDDDTICYIDIWYSVTLYMGSVLLGIVYVHNREVYTNDKQSYRKRLYGLSILKDIIEKSHNDEKEPREQDIEELDMAKLKQHFEELTNKWKKERNPFSSKIKDIINNNHYQDIISLGKDVVPHILEQLAKELNENNPDFWFPALTSITGENPVEPKNKGDIVNMAKDWLKWGNNNGICITK